MNFGKCFFLFIFCISYVEFGRAEAPKVESVKQDRYARAQRQGNRNVYYGRLILLDEPVRAIFEKKSIDLANVQHYPFPKGDCVVYTDQMKNALEASGQVKLREVREFWNSRKLHRADIHVFTQEDTREQSTISGNSSISRNGLTGMTKPTSRQHKTSSGGLWSLFLPFFQLFGWSKASNKSVHHWECQDCHQHYQTKKTKRS